MQRAVGSEGILSKLNKCFKKKHTSLLYWHSYRINSAVSLGFTRQLNEVTTAVLPVSPVCYHLVLIQETPKLAMETMICNREGWQRAVVPDANFNKKIEKSLSKGTSYRKWGVFFEALVLTDSKKQYTGHKAAGRNTQIVNSYTHFCWPQWEECGCDHCNDWPTENTQSQISCNHQQTGIF